MHNFLIKNKNYVFLAAILLLALFFRFWQLSSIPPGLYPDEAMNANDALNNIENWKNFKIFYPENNGREGLFIWLITLSFYLFGASIWSIKIVPAFFGLLTVFGIYLLTKQLFLFSNKIHTRRQIEAIALLSSFFLAISFWHINFSRIGFRGIMMPFFIVFGLYFLLKGFQKIIDNLASNQNKKKLIIFYVNFIISGLFFGLGFYTYISYRFIVILIPFILFLFWRQYKKQNLQKQFLLSTFSFLFSIFIIALPLGIYFLSHPADFFGRSAQVSIFNQKNSLWSLTKSIVLHLGMFNFYGDANWRHNYSGSPQLFWPVGIFFIIGLVLSFKNLIKSIKERDNFQWIAYFILIGLFFIFLLPGFLSAESNPHALRTIGVIPAVYIFVGIGAFWLFKKFKKFQIGKNKIIVFYLLVTLFLFTLIYVSFTKYFLDWAKRKEVSDAFSRNYINIGNYLNSLPEDLPKYVVVNLSGIPVPYPNGVSIPAQTVMFMEKTKYDKIRAIYLKPEELDIVNPLKKSVIIFMAEDNELFAKTLVLFPEDLFYKKQEFWIFKIKDKI